MNFSGKNIAILGAGGSGYAAAALALSCGAKASVFDSGNAEKLAPAVERFAALGAPLTCGEPALSAPGKFDFTVISPGIDASWPIARAFAAASGELIGEIEFAWRAAGDERAPVIGITGTNGKTTTTSLIEEMLRAAALKVVAAGNIGLPYCDVVRSGERHDWVVLELSSFQLETVSSFSPRIAVWMNFAPDHMDRYASLGDYYAAKFRIFENLAPGALAIHKLECELGLTARSSLFSAFREGGDYSYAGGAIHHPASGRSFDFSSCELQGKHNAENVMAALAVGRVLRIPLETMVDALKSYEPAAHRCELVAEAGGVKFINDSKATNLDAVHKALLAVPASQPGEPNVWLIAGGRDKGFEYHDIGPLLSQRVKGAFLIGETREKIRAAWSLFTPCALKDSLIEAVNEAAASAVAGDVVLLSPACSSFDQFQNYQHRGDVFRQAVAELSSAGRKKAG